MPIRRYLVGVALLLCAVATPAVAGRSATAQTGGDVVVQAVEDRPSGWKRAEAAHIVVTSKGSDAELRCVTTNLERLYAVMSRVFHRSDRPDDTIKLQVTLIDSANFFRTMGLKNLRSEEGPYAGAFAGQRYYDPREDGAVLAVARTDQLIDLDTRRIQDQAQDQTSDTGDATVAPTAAGAVRPVGRSWEAVLYSAFAQHFLLTYLPAAYPRWYLDGVGALFSTFEVRRDGRIDYARPPLDYLRVFRSYGDINVRDVLTGAYLDTAPNKTEWTPYHAWLLAHYFLFSNLPVERSRQFTQYIAAIQQGVPMAEAARVFGDLRKVQYAVSAYARNTKDFAKADAVPDLGGDLLVNALTSSSAALIEERIELGTRLAPVAAGDAAGAKQAADWLAQLHEKVRRLPWNPDAILTDAEAECRSRHYAECADAADRVLARAPDTVAALAWKGVAQTHAALVGPEADRAGGLLAARGTIARAIQLDGDAPLPRIVHFQSYVMAGERVPDPVMLGLARVVQQVPAAPAPRLHLAAELLRQDKTELARRVLYPVLFGGYDSPEKKTAQALFAPAAGAAQSGGR